MKTILVSRFKLFMENICYVILYKIIISHLTLFLISIDLLITSTDFKKIKYLNYLPYYIFSQLTKIH